MLHMQCSHISHPKSTTDTQTSLKDEIENAYTIDRFASEMKLLLSKFKEVQDKTNLQTVDLVKTVGQLKEKKENDCCVYGWKCKRKFCR